MIEIGNTYLIHAINVHLSVSFDRLISNLGASILNSLDCPTIIILYMYMSKLAIHQTKAKSNIFAGNQWCEDIENETHCAKWDFVVPRGQHCKKYEVE